MTKKSIIAVFVFIFLALAPAVFALDENTYKPSGWVNDYAGILDSVTVDKLNILIGEVQQKTGAEIAVVTIKSLEGDSLEDFTNRLFNKWGVGKKGKDNGIMLLVAYDDRKIRIEVGYGLEGAITDGYAGDIIREEITPRFKLGVYGDGVLAGVYVISKKIAAYYNTTIESDQPKNITRDRAVGTYRKASPFEVFIFIIFMIVMLIIFIKNPWLFILLMSSGGRGGRYGGGGGFGGGGFGGFGGGSSGGGGASGGW